MKKRKSVWRRSIYRKYVSGSRLQKCGTKFKWGRRCKHWSCGSPGQRSLEIEYLRASAIFVSGTSGMPPILNHRSVSPITASENILSRYRDGIWHRKIYPANKEKRETTYEWRNRNYHTKKRSVARRKGNVQILGNVGSGNHLISGDEKKKIWKAYLSFTYKLYVYPLIYACR